MHLLSEALPQTTHTVKKRSEISLVPYGGGVKQLDIHLGDI